MTHATQSQLEEQRTANEMTVRSCEALSRFITETNSIAKHMASSTSACGSDTKQVWQVLLGIEHSDAGFILDRIVDHANWLARLAQIITEQDKRAELADHRSCKLGKWFYSPDGRSIASRTTKTSAAFGRLEQPHENLHRTGIQAIQAMRNGDRENALSLMMEAYRISSDVVSILLDCAAVLEAETEPHKG
jgi:methyl-accepting chemotaxis protein